MMKDLDFKEISNAKIGSRIRQVVLLLVVILIGILISVSSEAGVPKNYQSKHACNQLTKKRNKSKNIEVRSVSEKKIKSKPMAEVDSPGASSRTLARRRQ
jgi:hypothetical protein